MNTWIEIVNRGTAAELDGVLPNNAPALRDFYMVRPDPLALMIMGVKGAVRATGRALNGVHLARQRAGLYAELSAKSDRSLADIGVKRADIPAIVQASFNQTPKVVPASAANDVVVPTFAVLAAVVRKIGMQVNEWLFEPLKIGYMQASLYKNLSEMSNARLSQLGLQRSEIVQYVIAAYPASTADIVVSKPVIPAPANDQAANDDVRLPAFPAKEATTAA